MAKKNSENLSSPQFVERLRCREKEAINVVVKNYTGHLYHAALGIGFSEAEAQDLAHDSFMTFFDVVQRFEGRSHIRTFLFGIFYNKVKEKRRLDKNKWAHDPFDEVLNSQFDDKGHWLPRPIEPDRFLAATESMEHVSHCLEKLPEMQKMVFMMKVVEELENDEICHALTISPTNLRQLLSRGKNRLRLCLESMFGHEVKEK